MAKKTKQKDSWLSAKSLIELYSDLLKKNKIIKNGKAHQRLYQLKNRYGYNK
tara:strand:- start:924 stop:1079 length:156 start_codon:yes stop_codon:yes gene_type:complete